MHPGHDPASVLCADTPSYLQAGSGLGTRPANYGHTTSPGPMGTSARKMNAYVCGLMMSIPGRRLEHNTRHRNCAQRELFSPVCAEVSESDQSLEAWASQLFKSWIDINMTCIHDTSLAAKRSWSGFCFRHPEENKHSYEICQQKTKTAQTVLPDVCCFSIHISL